MEDYIIDEIRKNREEILAENNYDLSKLSSFQEAEIKKLKENGWKIVTKKDVMKEKEVEKGTAHGK